MKIGDLLAYADAYLPDCGSTRCHYSPNPIKYDRDHACSCFDQLHRGGPLAPAEVKALKLLRILAKVVRCSP